MKRKLIYIFSILAIAIGVGVWVVFQPKQEEPIKKYVATLPNSENVTESAETTVTAAPTGEITPEERALKAKENFLAQIEFIGVDTENDSYWKLLDEAVNSPEYIEYQKKQDERLGTDLDLWWSFLESKGLSSGRMAQEERFREHFPTGDYTDYEPMMRKRLAELFLESGLHLKPTDDSDESMNETIEVMVQFRGEDEANSVWMRGHFNGYVGDLEWAHDVRKNAVSIVSDVGGTDAVSTLTDSEVSDESTLIEIAEENKVNESQPLLSGEDASVVEGSEQVTRPVEEIETEILKMFLPDVPELPTETSIENTLREHFSPQRLNTAMQTLNRYGPEEGLRRLKESDPEVATRVEQLIQRNKVKD